MACGSVISSSGWRIQREEQLEYGVTSFAETWNMERDGKNRKTLLKFCMVSRVHDVREGNIFVCDA